MLSTGVASSVTRWSTCGQSSGLSGPMGSSQRCNSSAVGGGWRKSGASKGCLSRSGIEDEVAMGSPPWVHTSNSRVVSRQGQAQRALFPSGWHNLPQDDRPLRPRRPRNIGGLAVYRGVREQRKQDSLQRLIGIAIGFWGRHRTWLYTLVQQAHQFCVIDSPTADKHFGNRPARPDEALVVEQDRGGGEGRAGPHDVSG